MIYDEDIKAMKKEKWKIIVKEAMQFKALQDLKSQIKDKTETKDLKYSNLEMQEYLKTNQISKKRKLLLFKLRTNMINVGYNYGKKEPCPVCRIPTEPDQQRHLKKCIVLQLSCPELLNSESEYDDIYSDDEEKMKAIAEELEIAIRKREEILESRTK